jgi:FdhE protein
MAKASLDWEALAEVALAARWDALPEVAARLPVSMQAFSVLLDWATRPVLRAAAERVSTVVRETPWERGTCPCCGSLPLLAEIRDADSERGRALRCGRCGWAWDYLRVGCPNCGERDHRHLGYVHVEGEGEYRRIAWCATCGFYLKELATLAPFGVDDLFEIDLATAALDLLAVERGYRRAT